MSDEENRLRRAVVYLVAPMINQTDTRYEKGICQEEGLFRKEGCRQYEECSTKQRREDETTYY